MHTLLDNRIYELTAGCDEQKIDLVAIQEHRWSTTKDIDTYWTEDKRWVMLYSTAIDGKGGLGILVNKRLSDKIIDYHKVSHRIIKATFNGNPKMTFISAHAPHGGYPLDTRQSFYNCLTDTIQEVPLHNILIIGGDLNAQLGKDLGNASNHNYGNTFYYDVTKNFSNGMLLAELCNTTNMTPVQTLFQHPKSKLWTHRRPNGDLEQLDHILINRKWINSVRSCQAHNSVELNSDHRILAANIKVSLQSHTKKKLPCKRNWNALQNGNISQEFKTKFKDNHNDALHIHNVNENSTPENLQCKYNAFIEAISKTGQETLPKIPRKQNVNPVTPESETIRLQRNRAKRNCAKNNSIENKAKVTDLNNKLRNSYRQDKVHDLEKDVQALQQADQNGDARTTWAIIKKLSGKNDESSDLGTMTKVDGTPIPPDEETHEWLLYFKDLLAGTIRYHPTY